MNRVQLKKGSDPANLFEQIKAMENQFRDLPQKLSEDDKIAAVLEKASDEYGVILANTAQEKGSRLTMDDLEDAMKIQWRIVKGTKESTNQPGKEFVLSAFTGKCYKCGQSGHKANECPNAEKEDKSGGRQKFTGKCNMCGKTGHKASQCWYDEKNAHLCPKWWKTCGNQKETGLSATGETNKNDSEQGKEFILMTINKMEFSTTASVLSDPNIFIRDTGASSDTTALDLGFRNKKPAKTSNNIVDASGNSLTGQTIGNVSGVFCDKYGNKQNNVVIGYGLLTGL